jgi:hypothetical protein
MAHGEPAGLCPAGPSKALPARPASMARSRRSRHGFSVKAQSGVPALANATPRSSDSAIIKTLTRPLTRSKASTRPSVTLPRRWHDSLGMMARS